MANIEIERTNKLLYKNLTSIENKTKIQWNPMVEKIDQMSEINLHRRRVRMQEIEKANFHFLKKLENINSDYRQSNNSDISKIKNIGLSSRNRYS